MIKNVKIKRILLSCFLIRDKINSFILWLNLEFIQKNVSIEFIVKRSFLIPPSDNNQRLIHNLFLQKEREKKVINKYINFENQRIS